MSLRPDGGMTSVLSAMFAESTAVVRLNSRVTSVSRAGAWTQVRLSGGQAYRSRVVVVATPVNTWNTIAFTPGLPKVHTDAVREGVGVPHATKVWLHVRGSSEAVYAQSDETGPIQLLLPQQELPGGRLYVRRCSPVPMAARSVAMTAPSRAVTAQERPMGERGQSPTPQPPGPTSAGARWSGNGGRVPEQKVQGRRR
ncbi:Putative flavin-containing monoamine oxidase AofH OS=Streptomyces microflavus OX=1919 GN=aofH_1 PE=4 SV=1 [Streptomyces microflavus]